MNKSTERYPVEEAERVIPGRLESGSRVLSIEGVWVDDIQARTDTDYVATFSPDGSDDPDTVSEAFRQWPRDESFCLDIVFVR